MSISLNTISRGAVSFLNENLLQVLSSLNKKVLIIAAAAFACLAAYMISRYCFSAQLLDEKKAPSKPDGEDKKAPSKLVEEILNVKEVSEADAKKEISPKEESKELPQSDENGTLNGPGERIYPNEKNNPRYYWLPATAKGTFKNGKLIGQGSMTFHNGTVFEGEFDSTKSGSNYLNGEGKRVEKSIDGEVEAIYEGTFQEHKLHGKGMIFLPNGGTWKGKFEFGVLVEGSIEYKHGPIQSEEGKFAWHGNQLNGEGKRVYRTGKVEEGIFENGVLITPKK